MRRPGNRVHQTTIAAKVNKVQRHEQRLPIRVMILVPLHERSKAVFSLHARITASIKKISSNPEPNTDHPNE